MTIQIFRVENEKGEGIYRNSTKGIGQLTNEMACDSLHPHPREDSSISEWYIKYITDRHYFGFVSLNQLKMWIHSDDIRQGLAKLGFTINTYIPTYSYPSNTRDFVLGDTQAIFNKDLFTKISSMEFSELS